jgi:oligoendopeptidase F
MKAPSWNLDDLYKGIADPKIQHDLEVSKSNSLDFSKKYETKIASLSAEGVAKAIQEYEKLGETLGRLGSFARLVFAQDMTDKKGVSFYQRTEESLIAISTNFLFFTLELNDIPDATLESYFNESKALAHYKPWITQVRTFKKYQLSKDMEKILHEKSGPSCSSWIRLYDETFSELRFPFNGKNLTATDIGNLLLDPNAKTRAKAAKVFAKVLKENVSLFTLIYNTLIKDKEIDDRWRGYKAPIESRNKANLVDDKVVESLITSVKNYYPKLSHRYYKLKAKWMGKKKIPYWDRNAPLLEDDNRLIPWEEAKKIVLKSYRDFSPHLADTGEIFFDKNWIDAALRPGKDSGAFSHPTVPSVHPYILQNYHGKAWDVMTLAHELGHGIHQTLAAKQGDLMASTPLTLAETASIFGEMLTFHSLLSQTTDPKRRKVILAGKVGDMLNTVVRQISFCEFEKAVHEKRKQGELTPEQIGEIWIGTQKKSLGPSIIVNDDYINSWSYISHFFHVPFYVYAYAFGNCLVNSLYAVYRENPMGFQEKYIALLSAGGTLSYKEILAPFGLDAEDPNFWNKGLEMICDLIDELEKLP